MNTNDMSMIDGEPDTSRGVRPVPREGVGNLPPGSGKAPLPYPTICIVEGYGIPSQSRSYSTFAAHIKSSFILIHDQDNNT